MGEIGAESLFWHQTVPPGEGDNANKRQKLPDTSLKGRTDLHQDIEKVVAMESSKEPIDATVKTEGFRTAMAKPHYGFRNAGLKRGMFDQK